MAESPRENERINTAPAPQPYSSTNEVGGNVNANRSSQNDASRVPQSQPDLDEGFVCNVCLDPVKDPVVTQCGHLYCWPCLFRWLNAQHTTCPVCKSNVSRENVIPIFIKGCDKDPRRPAAQGSEGAGEDVPNRPLGQRPEAADPILNVNNGNLGATATQFGISFTGNFGFFPSLFGLQFQTFIPSNPNRLPDTPLSPEEQHQKFLSNILILMGSAVFFCFLAF